MGNFIDLTGKTFNHLIVLEPDYKRNELEQQRREKGEIKSRHYFWIVLCTICNEKHSMEGYKIRNGCGMCLHCSRKHDFGGKFKRKYNTYEDIDEDTIKMSDCNGNFAYINKKILNTIKEIYWNKNPSDGYWYSNQNNEPLHRFIYIQEYGEYNQDIFLVDHLDRNKDNNKIDNFRLVTYSENNKNQKISKRNKSGIKGVFWDKRSSRWVARIGDKGKSIHIKTCKTLHEAFKSRLEAEKKYGFINQLDIKNKLIVLIGESNSGKDTILTELVNDFNLKRVVSHTSRPARKKEKNGLDYFFISNEDFLSMEKNEAFVETRIYKTIQNGQDTIWRYGISKAEINLNKDSCIVIVDVDGLNSLIKTFGKENIVSFYIKVDKEVRKTRALRRGDEISEIERRFKDDYIKFKNVEDIVDYIISNNGDMTPKDVASLIYAKLV